MKLGAKVRWTLLVLTVVGAVSTTAARGNAAEVTGIAVYPPDITLQTKLDSQQFIVVATRDDGVTLDITEAAAIKLADEGIGRLEGTTVFPAKDGDTTLNIEYAGHQATATVNVKDAAADRPVSFHLDIMPIFMRSGCNTGSCHGAASGKDGFNLSLFGFDPRGDYQRITREIGFRRINLAVPEASLLVEKAVGAVPHSGGKQFEVDSAYNAMLIKWLKAVVPQDAGVPPHVTKMDVYPPAAVIEGKDTRQQFIARAHYSDGTTRDVTALSVFLTSNDTSAPINEDGLVTAADRGEAFVMARFETKTVGSQVLVLPKDLVYTPPEITGNYIDQLVGDKLRKIRMMPSGKCSDEEFIRRATIDIAGLLPTEEEFVAFMADTAADKRAKLVNTLLDRKEFSEIWAMKWSELLMVKTTNQVSKKSMYLYSSWLTDQIASNVPLNEMVTELLGASGGTFKNPAANYYQIERDTLKTAENVAQVFMGIRTQCAQCHNHPFDRWTMDDYYSFAAFFSQIGRKAGEDYREQIIFNSGGGEVRHKVGNRVMKPKFLGGEEPDLTGVDRRVAMAKWLTSAENPYFSTSVANRVWAHFFGSGIVEPIDDIRVSNPPSNPQLFSTLGEKLVEYNYDFKQLVRDICNSETYQRSTVRNPSNEKDTRNFAFANVRRISAESLLDCTTQVTETKDKFPGLPLGSRAVQVADGGTSTYFLTTFGRAKRETVCSCEVSQDPSLSQALHMLNGDTAGGKITQGGLVKRMIDAGKTPEQIIESIYIRCLSRRPVGDEMPRLMAVVTESATPQAGLEDVFWAVLNSREFLFNH